MYINSPNQRTIERARKYRNESIQREDRIFLATKLFILSFFLGFLLLMYVLIANAETIRSIL